MRLQFTVPDQPPVDFLLPSGVAISVGLIDANREKIAGLTAPIVGFDSSHILFLLDELIFLLRNRWKHRIQKEIELFEGQKAVLQNGTLKVYFDTIEGMRDVVMQSGEYFVSLIDSYAEGAESEDDHGGNITHQSILLAECTLFALRLGVDTEILDRWKTKLREIDRKILERNMTIKPESPKK